MKRIPMKTGDEFDALTGWRNVLHWRTGERARIKRAYRRRERNANRVSLWAGIAEYWDEWYSAWENAE